MWKMVVSSIFSLFLTVLFFLKPFPKRHILDYSKLKEFADDNFIFDKNGRKFFKLGRKHRGNSFYHSVFKRLVMLTS